MYLKKNECSWNVNVKINTWKDRILKWDDFIKSTGTLSIDLYLIKWVKWCRVVFVLDVAIAYEYLC